MKKTMILPLLAWMLGLTYVVAQERASPFILHRTGMNGYVDRIFFVDTLNGDTLNEFDVVANNPYGQFDLPVLNSGQLTFDAEFWMKVYDVSTPQLQEKFQNVFMDIDSASTEFIHTLRSFMISSEQNTDRIANRKYLGIAYNLRVVEEFGDDYPEARNSTLVVFNSTGEVLRIFPDFGTNIIGVFISEDGQYVAAIFGTGSAHAYIEKRGVRVYSVATGQLLTQVESDCGGGYGINQNTLLFVCGLDYFVFIPTVPAMYKTTLTLEQSLRSLTVNDTGISLTINGANTLLTYLEDFERIW